MRSRQVSLPRLRWRTTPGSFEPGARRACAMRCSVRDLVEHRRPGVGSGGERRRAAVARPTPSRRRDHRHHLAGGDGVAGAPGAARRVDHAGARRRHDRLHLHRADDQERVAGGHDVAFAHAHLDHGARHRARATCRRPAARPRRGRRRPAGAARRAGWPPVDRAVPPAARAAPARPPRLAVRAAPSAARDARPAASCAHRRRERRRARGCARSCARLVGRPATWNSSSARSVRSTAEANDAGRAGRADHLGEQRVELRRRRVAQVAAGVDAHAGAATAPCRR